MVPVHTFEDDLYAMGTVVLSLLPLFYADKNIFRNLPSGQIDLFGPRFGISSLKKQVGSVSTIWDLIGKDSQLEPHYAVTVG